MPLDLGGNRRGTDMGPSAFRIAGFGEQLATLGLRVVDKGDVPSPIPEAKGAGDPRKRYVKDIARVCQRLFQTSLSSFSEGAMPIVLGGDHSLGAGSVAAAAAHLRKQRQAARVDLGGCARRHEQSGVERIRQRARHAAGGAARTASPRSSRTSPAPAPAVLPKHTVLVGIRNLDEVEKKIVRASKVQVFTMKEIDRLGIAEVMARAIAIATEGTGGFHVSYDLDVVRSDGRARRRHAGQRRPQLSRGARRDGDGRRSRGG